MALGHLESGRAEDHPGYDAYGNIETDCIKGEGWWTGEGSMGEKACEWVADVAGGGSGGIGNLLEKGKEFITGGISKLTGGIRNLFSDERMKKSIKLVGKSPSGINVYEFSYKNPSNGAGKYRGVIAQEVPWASYLDEETGFFKTDYSRVDVEFERID